MEPAYNCADQAILFTPAGIMGWPLVAGDRRMGRRAGHGMFRRGATGVTWLPLIHGVWPGAIARQSRH